MKHTKKFLPCHFPAFVFIAFTLDHYLQVFPLTEIPNLCNLPIYGPIWIQNYENFKF